MDNPSNKKFENLSLVRGGAYARPTAALDIQLEREVRERVIRVRSTHRRASQDRALGCIAADVTHPTRVKARLVRKMKALGVSFEDMCAALFQPELTYAKRVYGQHETGEHPRSA